MPPANAERGDLGRRSVTALLWGAGGSVVRILIQIGSQIVLARILGPELYGVFAVALVGVLLSSLFADVGLAYGLIQKAHVSDEDIRFVFTWQTLLGIAMTALLFALAPVIAGLAGDARLIPVIQMLAPSCLINSAGATSGSLLRRDLDFKTLNIAAVVSYAAGFLLAAIPLALAGFGVHALVAGFLVQSSVMVAIQYAKVRHSVRPLLWQPEAPSILSFGATVLATNLVNWAMGSIDRAIVGSALGLAAAGLYATAYNLISTPVVTLLALLQSVFYSASAKVQDDRAQLGRGLKAMFGSVLLFVAPALAAIAIASETIFLTLYGAKWSGGGEILAPLALAMPAMLLMGLATPVLWASGATQTEFRLQIPIAVVWIGALMLVGRWGSLALLGWAVCLLFYIRAGVIIAATVKAIGMAPRELAGVCTPGLAVTALVAAGAALTETLLARFLGHGALLLAADIGASGIALLAGLRLVSSRIGIDVRRVVGDLVERLPGARARWLARVLLGGISGTVP